MDFTPLREWPTMENSTHACYLFFVACFGFSFNILFLRKL
ncbi:hypothetical protein MUK42_35052, partial [Musa troglodytarum]